MRKVDHTSGGRRPCVVIVGAGFAGLNAARALAKAPVDVVLIDRNNYHRFEPLLYQVATAGLEADEIAHSIRDLLRRQANVRFRLGTVRAVDPERRQVLLQSGPPVAYDYLVLAAGTVTSYFGVAGAAQHAFPMKTVPDALNLRNQILRQFERYDRDPAARTEGALNFVIVGGGPTGVEMAGALVELFRHVLQDDFRDLDTRRARVYLLEQLPDLLSGYDPAQRAYTRRVLERRGVTVMTGTTVERVTPDAVHLSGGRRIPTETLIWAAGVRAGKLAELPGAEQVQGGRIAVMGDLSLPAYPEVFVAGDLGAAQDEVGRLYPQLAPVAIQQGRHAAAQIQHLLAGRPTERFRYRDYGEMATIGRNAAVAQFPGGLRVKGFAAWFLWVFIHIAKLIGFRHRASVFANWVYSYFTYDRSARLILDVVPISDEVPHEVDEVDRQVREKLLELSQ